MCAALGELTSRSGSHAVDVATGPLIRTSLRQASKLWARESLYRISCVVEGPQVPFLTRRSSDQSRNGCRASPTWALRGRPVRQWNSSARLNYVGRAGRADFAQWLPRGRCCDRPANQDLLEASQQVV